MGGGWVREWGGVEDGIEEVSECGVVGLRNGIRVGRIGRGGVMYDGMLVRE